MLEHLDWEKEESVSTKNMNGEGFEYTDYIPCKGVRSLPPHWRAVLGVILNCNCWCGWRSGVCRNPFIAIISRFTLTQSGGLGWLGFMVIQPL